MITTHRTPCSPHDQFIVSVETTPPKMYRFVEKERYEGRTVRSGGSTNRSLKALKHLPKVGNPLRVRGYTYKGAYGSNHVGVMVHGEKGTIRFSGFAWGYMGQGPRGLNDLFKLLGVKKCASDLPQMPSFNTIGEHWAISL